MEATTVFGILGIFAGLGLLGITGTAAVIAWQAVSEMTSTNKMQRECLAALEDRLIQLTVVNSDTHAGRQYMSAAGHSKRTAATLAAMKAAGILNEANPRDFVKPDEPREELPPGMMPGATDVTLLGESAWDFPGELSEWNQEDPQDILENEDEEAESPA